MSDVPVAAFLSGGLDSSAVVTSMALAGGPPHAFTARYQGSGSAATDETALARSLATRYGAELTVVDIRPELRDILEPIVRALDEPLADDSAVPTWLLSRAVASRYKVALTGIGGDELFAGYRRHAGLLAGERYGRLPRTLRGVAAAVGDLIPDSLGTEMDRVKRFLRAGSGARTSTAERYFDLQCRAADGLRAQLYRADVRGGIAANAARERFGVMDEGAPRSGLAAALSLDYKVYLPDDILALSDRLSMAHSLEVRVPLVDHELVERVFPLPDELKMRRWQLKSLLRRALRERLPAEHFRAPKRGFVGPTASWLRGELRGMLLDELSPDRVARLGFFNPRTVARLLDEHFSHRHNRESILWALLCFSTWHRLFVEQSAPAGEVSARVAGAAGSAGSRSAWAG